MKNKFIDFIHSLQDQICSELEIQDGESRFLEDSWIRDGGGGGRGGGRRGAHRVRPSAEGM